MSELPASENNYDYDSEESKREDIMQTLNQEIGEEEQQQEEIQEGTPNLVFKQTDIWLIAGKRGSGKTNLLLYLIDFLIKSGIPIVVVDPVYDLEGNLKQLYGSQYQQLFGDKGQNTLLHIRYQDRNSFDKLLEKVLKKNWKGVLVVDEADGFFPNSQRKLTPIENHFIQIGRHHGVGLICVTRRLAKLHTDVPSQANKLCMFKHWQRADIDYLKESNLGDYAQYLRSLEKYHFLFLETDVEYCQICTPVPKMK